MSFSLIELPGPEPSPGRPPAITSFTIGVDVKNGDILWKLTGDAVGIQDQPNSEFSVPLTGVFPLFPVSLERSPIRKQPTKSVQ